MENNKQVKDPYRSALKKKAMAFMPKNYEDINAQRQILAMIVAVVPAAANCAKAADASLWPKVQAKSLPIIQAVGKCAMEVNKAIAAVPMESLLLEKRSYDMLMKAWVALDYYSYLMLPEYSANIRTLRDRIFAILRQRDMSMAGHPRPVPPVVKPTPVAAVPPQPPKHQPPYDPRRVQGVAEDPNKTVMVERPVPGFQAEDINKTVMVERPVPSFEAEDINKTVMVERPVPSFEAEDINKTAMVDRPVPSFEAEDINKTVSVDKAPMSFDDMGTTQFSPDQENSTFTESPEIGTKGRRNRSGGKTSKTPIIIAAAALVVIAVVALLVVNSGKAVTKAEEAIGAIGVVSMESKDAIEAAEALYEDLSASNQKKVENRDELTAARAEYDRMSGAIAKVEQAIDAIKKPVGLDSGDLISSARNEYDLLDEDLKGYVSNYSALCDAEKTYNVLYAEEQSGIAYRSARSAFDTGDYTTALDKLDGLLDAYPSASVAMDAKTMAASCAEVLAQTAMSENRLEDAMILLKKAQEDYVVTEKINSLYEQLVTRLQALRPSNGKMFAVKTEQGYNSVNITAKGSDLCIKLISTENPEKYTCYYIREDESFTFFIKDGQYTLQYAYGECWYGQDALFGEEGSYNIMKAKLEMKSSISGGVVSPQYYVITLDVNRKWDKEVVTRDQF